MVDLLDIATKLEGAPISQIMPELLVEAPKVVEEA